MACFGVEIVSRYEVELERKDKVREQSLVRVRGDRPLQLSATSADSLIYRI